MKPRRDYQLDMGLVDESRYGVDSRQPSTVDSSRGRAGPAVQEENTGDKIAALRAADFGANRTARLEPSEIRVASILAALQTTQATVLSLPRVANAFAASPEGSALVFTQQAPQVVATCPPYQAPLYSSVVGSGEIEYQCDLFTMSQTGA